MTSYGLYARLWGWASSALLTCGPHPEAQICWVPALGTTYFRCYYNILGLCRQVNNCGNRRLHMVIPTKAAKVNNNLVKMGYSTFQLTHLHNYVMKQGKISNLGTVIQYIFIHNTSHLYWLHICTQLQVLKSGFNYMQCLTSAQHHHVLPWSLHLLIL